MALLVFLGLSKTVNRSYEAQRCLGVYETLRGAYGAQPRIGAFLRSFINSFFKILESMCQRGRPATTELQADTLFYNLLNYKILFDYFISNKTKKKTHNFFVIRLLFYS